MQMNRAERDNTPVFQSRPVQLIALGHFGGFLIVGPPRLARAILRWLRYARLGRMENVATNRS
jgi:hypothetical protein